MFVATLLQGTFKRYKSSSGSLYHEQDNVRWNDISYTGLRCVKEEQEPPRDGKSIELCGKNDHKKEKDRQAEYKMLNEACKAKDDKSNSHKATYPREHTSGPGPESSIEKNSESAESKNEKCDKTDVSTYGHFKANAAKLCEQLNLVLQHAWAPTGSNEPKATTFRSKENYCKILRCADWIGTDLCVCKISLLAIGILKASNHFYAFVICLTCYLALVWMNGRHHNLQERKLRYIQFRDDLIFNCLMLFLNCIYPYIDLKQYISWTIARIENTKRYTEDANLISNMQNYSGLSFFVILFLLQCVYLCPRQMNEFNPSQSLSNVQFKGDLQSDNKVFRDQKPLLRQELISMGDIEEDIQRSQIFLFFALIVIIFLCLLTYTIYKRYKQRGEDIRMLQNSNLSKN